MVVAAACTKEEEEEANAAKIIAASLARRRKEGEEEGKKKVRAIRRRLGRVDLQRVLLARVPLRMVELADSVTAGPSLSLGSFIIIL